MPSTRVERDLGPYLGSRESSPLFLVGDARETLARFPGACVDCCMTSPPYWGQRAYSAGGIGLEGDPREYVEALLAVVDELARVLSSRGSFWLNLGDGYRKKCLAGIPWRVALAMTDGRGWILRNSVVWNKVKGGPDNVSDKLRNVHEHVFHFVRSSRYHYDADAVRSKPRSARVVGGAVVSATGVSGVRYKRQIELSTALDEGEKRAACAALERVLDDVREGRLADFRMILRGRQRATHSDSTRVSGRARELEERGFYFLKYHPGGAKPGDVWDVLPEDTHRRGAHYAAYPPDLCRIPILATCPPGGIVLDPFCGTGTTNLVAQELGRRSIGIDLSPEYVARARERCAGGA